MKRTILQKCIALFVLLAFMFGQIQPSFANENLSNWLASDNAPMSETRNSVAKKTEPGAIGNGRPLIELLRESLPAEAQFPVNSEKTQLLQDIRAAVKLAISLHMENRETIPSEHLERSEKTLSNLVQLQNELEKSLYLFGPTVQGEEDYLLGFNMLDTKGIIGLDAELAKELNLISRVRLAQYIYHECVPEHLNIGDGDEVDRDDHRIIYNEIQSKVFGEKEVSALGRNLRNYISRSDTLNDSIYSDIKLLLKLLEAYRQSDAAQMAEAQRRVNMEKAEMAEGVFDEEDPLADLVDVLQHEKTLQKGFDENQGDPSETWVDMQNNIEILQGISSSEEITDTTISFLFDNILLPLINDIDNLDKGDRAFLLFFSQALLGKLKDNVTKLALLDRLTALPGLRAWLAEENVGAIGNGAQLVGLLKGRLPDEAVFVDPDLEASFMRLISTTVDIAIKFHDAKADDVPAELQGVYDKVRKNLINLQDNLEMVVYFFKSTVEGDEDYLLGFNLLGTKNMVGLDAVLVKRLMVSSPQRLVQYVYHECIPESIAIDKSTGTVDLTNHRLAYTKIQAIVFGQDEVDGLKEDLRDYIGLPAEDREDYDLNSMVAAASGASSQSEEAALYGEEGGYGDDEVDAVVDSSLYRDEDDTDLDDDGDDTNDGFIGKGESLKNLLKGFLPKEDESFRTPDRRLQKTMVDTISAAIGIAIEKHSEAGDRIPAESIEAYEKTSENLRRLRNNLNKNIYLFYPIIRGSEDYLLGFNLLDSKGIIGLDRNLVLRLNGISPLRLAQYIWHESYPENLVLDPQTGEVDLTNHRTVYKTIQPIVFGEQEVRALTKDLRKYITDDLSARKKIKEDVTRAITKEQLQILVGIAESTMSSRAAQLAETARRSAIEREFLSEGEEGEDELAAVIESIDHEKTLRGEFQSDSSPMVSQEWEDLGRNITMVRQIILSDEVDEGTALFAFEEILLTLVASTTGSEDLARLAQIADKLTSQMRNRKKAGELSNRFSLKLKAAYNGSAEDEEDVVFQGDLMDSDDDGDDDDWGAIGNGKPLVELAKGNLPQKADISDSHIAKIKEAIGIALDLYAQNKGAIPAEYQDKVETAYKNIILLQDEPESYLFLFSPTVLSGEDYLLGFNRLTSKGHIGMDSNLVDRLSPVRLAQFIFHESLPEALILSQDGKTVDRENHRANYLNIQTNIFGEEEVKALGADLREYIASRLDARAQSLLREENLRRLMDILEEQKHNSEKKALEEMLEGELDIASEVFIANTVLNLQSQALGLTIETEIFLLGFFSSLATRLHDEKTKGILIEKFAEANDLFGNHEILQEVSDSSFFEAIISTFSSMVASLEDDSAKRDYFEKLANYDYLNGPRMTREIPHMYRDEKAQFLNFVSAMATIGESIRSKDIRTSLLVNFPDMIPQDEADEKAQSKRKDAKDLYDPSLDYVKSEESTHPEEDEEESNAFIYRDSAQDVADALDNAIVRIVEGNGLKDDAPVDATQESVDAETAMNREIMYRAELLKNDLLQILSQNPDKPLVLAIDSEIGQEQQAQVMAIYKVIDYLRSVKGADGNPLFPNLIVVRGSGSKGKLAQKVRDLLDSKEMVIAPENVLMVVRHQNYALGRYQEFQDKSCWITSLDDSKSTDNDKGSYLPILEAVTLTIMAALTADKQAIKDFYDSVANEPIELDHLDQMLTNRVIYLLPKMKQIKLDLLKEHYELVRNIYEAA
ncbi:hypothetical protein ACFL4E_02200 [Candidatus Omnitrophota bacterium]